MKNRNTMQLVMCMNLGMPLLAACDDNSNDDSSQRNDAAVGVDASTSAVHSSSIGEHATKASADGGSAHNTCTEVHILGGTSVAHHIDGPATRHRE